MKLPQDSGNCSVDQERVEAHTIITYFARMRLENCFLNSMS
jgi:hypothetical protein